MVALAGRRVPKNRCNFTFKNVRGMHFSKEGEGVRLSPSETTAVETIFSTLLAPGFEPMLLVPRQGFMEPASESPGSSESRLRK